jgi:hypothetical protein
MEGISRDAYALFPFEHLRKIWRKQKLKFGGKSMIASAICFLKFVKTAKNRRPSTRLELRSVCPPLSSGLLPDHRVSLTFEKAKGGKLKTLLLLFSMGGAMHASPIAYTFNFSGGSPNPTGSFSYDSNTNTFSNVVLAWNGAQQPSNFNQASPDLCGGVAAPAAALLVSGEGAGTPASRT